MTSPMAMRPSLGAGAASDDTESPAKTRHSARTDTPWPHSHRHKASHPRQYAPETSSSGLRHPNCRAHTPHRERVGQTKVYLARLLRSPSALPVKCKCLVLRKADTEGISDTYSMQTRVELCGNVQQKGLILAWF